MKIIGWLKSLFVEFLSYMSEPPISIEPAFPVECDTPEQAFFWDTRADAEEAAAEYNEVAGTQCALPLVYTNDEGVTGYVVRIFGETPERTIGYVRYV